MRAPANAKLHGDGSTMASEQTKDVPKEPPKCIGLLAGLARFGLFAFLVFHLRRGDYRPDVSVCASKLKST